ncbi:Hsp20/alpha crystallin family protein [Fuchsiella alkaliacetigena]|uniref:Hsp20/alpha crystallin family protein n=1 Tax=Fuchsiella alkaliacetigena TaxID=957042 RepID=UPI002009F912|nr:Hsp20/alpha crystallin family protein [Fuchsiella alkaliacetigena]MCK8824384.1 Hsp20/alpha crystallin family protein [Fuchsiella alkaliacetigena]
MKSTTWNPLREMKKLREQISNFLAAKLQNAATLGRKPSIDIYESKDEVVVKSNLPGIDPTEVEIMVGENNLVIQGEAKEEEEVEVEVEDGYHRVERYLGNFSRSVTLPARVKHEEATASAEHGVLEIRMPKTEVELEDMTRLRIKD